TTEAPRTTTASKRWPTTPASTTADAGKGETPVPRNARPRRAFPFPVCSEPAAAYHPGEFTRISCMPLGGTKIGRVLRQRREDAAIAWTFFRQWLKAPLTTAAVSPSSKE